MSATTQASANDILGDPLSGATRSSKRLMLVFSCISLLIVFTGVTPDEVGVFGLKFPGLTISLLNTGLLWIFAISIFSFLVYGISDLLRYRHRIDVYKQCRARDMDAKISTDPSSYEAQQTRFYEQEFEGMTGYKPFNIPHAPAKVLVYLRGFLDFGAPALFAIFCYIYFILRHVSP